MLIFLLSRLQLLPILHNTYELKTFDGKGVSLRLFYSLSYKQNLQTKFITYQTIAFREEHDTQINVFEHTFFFSFHADFSFRPIKDPSTLLWLGGMGSK